MVIGPFINASAILFGGILGALLSQHIPERIRVSMTSIFGLASLGIGILLVIKCANLPVMVLATLVGALIGEFCHLEKGINAAVAKAQQLFTRSDANVTHESFIQSYVAIIVLFCASGTGIFGAIHEGMTGDPNILIAKSFFGFLHGHHFCLFAGNRGIRHLHADAGNPVNACHLCSTDFTPDDASYDGRFQRRRRSIAAGNRFAYLRHQNVCGCEYASCPAAGNAAFRRLDGIFCLRMRALAAMW